MRQYQPIWERIKKVRTATIIAPATSHARIIQAVRKEKCKDVGFKLLTQEAGITFKLSQVVDKKKSTITFNLIDATGIKVTDL